MRNTMKKWITGILATVMITSMTIVPVAAAETTTETIAHTHSLNEIGVCTTCEMNVLSLLNTAYIYSFPLVLMDVTAEKVTNTETATYTQAPINQFVHVPAFADAEAKDIVLPNVDTLYSQAFLDLSETAVIMELPKTDRFCIMQAMDAYSNTIEIIECMHLEDRTTYIFTGPDFDGTIPDGMIEIKSPTNMVWILGRTVCGDNENNLADGYLITRTIQYQMKMYTLEQYENGTADVPLTGEVEEEYKNIVPLDYVIYNLTAEEFFDRANALMLDNPPAAEDAAAAAAMAAVGVGPGLDFDPAVFGGEAVVNAFYGWIRQNLVNNCMGASAAYNQVNGVWSYYGDPIGDYGTAYAFRSLIALAGFGANPAEMAIYPAASTDNTGTALTGANAYTLHITTEQLALLNKHNGFGFWSVTAYGVDQYLIANEENRYCINDRNVVYNEDGSIDLYVSKDAPADAEKYPNWLPVGEEGFKLYFRIYLPCEEILENNWTMPGIVKVEAETGEDGDLMTDLDSTAWYYEDVRYCLDNGFMIGTGDNTFSPDATLTRAMLVTALWRLENEPVVDALMSFDDVEAEQWYTEAIRWAASEGIVNGYGNGSFGTNDAITREQVMAILHRYTVCKELDNGVIFPMIPQYAYSAWAENDIIWADMIGLTAGIGVDISDMTANASRAEIAAYLRRFFEGIGAE